MSPEAAWTTVEIAFPLSCGISERELARRHGVPGAWINARLGELRAELEREPLP